MSSITLPALLSFLAVFSPHRPTGSVNQQDAPERIDEEALFGEGIDLGPNEVPLTTLIVGDQIVSFMTLQQLLQREMMSGRVPAGSNRELLEAFNDIRQEAMVRLIKVQAGKDLGFAPEVIDGIVRRQLASVVEANGGAVDAARRFERSGLGAAEFQELTRERVYATQWERAAIGLGPGGRGRPYVDRYLRPGMLYAEYQARADSNSERVQAEVGRHPTRVRLQQLLIDVERHGGEEEALLLGRTIRDSLDAGADFSEIIRLHDEIKKNDGLLAPQTLRTLKLYSRHLFQDDRLHDFAMRGEPGDYLGPEIGQPRGRGRALFLYKIVERLEPTEATSFVDRRLQRRLRERVQKAIDDAHLWAAIEERSRATFLWPRDKLSGGRADEPETTPEALLIEGLGG